MTTRHVWWVLMVIFWGFGRTTFENLAQDTPATPTESMVTDLMWSPVGDEIAIAVNDGVLFINPADISQAKFLPLAGARSLAYSPQGDLLAVGDTHSALHLFDLTTDEEVLLWQVEPDDPANPASIVSVAFTKVSKEGLFLAVATSRNGLSMYELKENTVRWLINDGNFATVVRFSADGKELACGNSQLSIDIRDSLSGEVKGAWKLEPLAIPTIYDMAFSPGGEHLLVAGNSSRVLALDFSFGSAGYVWDVLGDEVLNVDWSSDGRLVGMVNHNLAEPNYNVVQIFSADSGGVGREQATEVVFVELVGHDDVITGFDFSPDGMLAVTTSDDGTLRLWDTTNGAEIAQISLP